MGLYILHEGEVTLSMTSQEGRSILSVQAMPGSLLGLPGSSATSPTRSPRSLAPAHRSAFVSSAEFSALMESNPPLSLKMLQVLAAEVRSARNALY